MRIAIVDDDRAFLESLSLILKDEGHQTAIFSSAKEALGFFGPRAGELDILILDYRLPDGTGCELLERIRESLPPRCKVIMVSGHSDVLSREQLECWGVAAFLPKPLDLDRLFELMREGVVRKP